MFAFHTWNSKIEIVCFQRSNIFTKHSSRFFNSIELLVWSSLTSWQLSTFFLEGKFLESIFVANWNFNCVRLSRSREAVIVTAYFCAFSHNWLLWLMVNFIAATYFTAKEWNCGKPELWFFRKDSPAPRHICVQFSSTISQIVRIPFASRYTCLQHVSNIFKQKVFHQL